MSVSLSKAGGCSSWSTVDKPCTPDITETTKRKKKKKIRKKRERKKKGKRKKRKKSHSDLLFTPFSIAKARVWPFSLPTMKLATFASEQWASVTFPEDCYWFIQFFEKDSRTQCWQHPPPAHSAMARLLIYVIRSPAVNPLGKTATKLDSTGAFQIIITDSLFTCFTVVHGVEVTFNNNS